jgi:hypothetical protein
MTVDGMVGRATQVLGDPAALGREPGLREALEKLVRCSAGDGRTELDLGVLLRLAGFAVCRNYDPRAKIPTVSVQRSTRLADAVRAWAATPDRTVGLIGDAVLLAAGDGDRWFDPWPPPPLVQPAANPLNQVGVQNNLGVGGGVFGIGGGQLGTARSVPRPAANFLGGFGGGGGVLMPGGSPAGSGLGIPPAPAPAVAPALGTLPEADAGLVRQDFADTAYWSVVRTDATGRATLTVPLPDSLTTWRVSVTAVSDRMHVGTGDAVVNATKPLMIWPVLPRGLTEGDTVRLPATVRNLTDRPETVRATLVAESGSVLSAAEVVTTVPAGGSAQVGWTYRAGRPGAAILLFSARSPTGTDAVRKHLPVAADRAPEVAAASGTVGGRPLTLDLPPGYDPASVSLSATVAPSLAADVATTLPYLVEYPYGCVEQTMSRFLPALLAARVLKKSGVPMPDLEKKLPGVAAAGIRRLLILQRPDGGWGWHAGGDAHEMMTPYALLGLLEAERAGYPCPNPQAIDRGLRRLQVFLTQMAPVWGDLGKSAGPVPAVNDSLYVLAVWGRRQPVPDPWWGRIEAAVGSPAVSDYGHALALDLAVRAGRKPLADKLAAVLRTRATQIDGRVSWSTAGFSRWAADRTEVTAAALSALVAHDPADPLIPGVLAEFAATKRGDRWGSTKDTAMVLLAACDYLTAVPAGAAGPAAGVVGLAVNGGDPMAVDLGGAGAKTVSLPTAGLRPGSNVVTVTAPKSATGALVRVLARFTRGGPTIPARGHGITVARTLSVRTAAGEWRDLADGATVAVGSHVRVRVTAAPTDEPGLAYVLVESPRMAGGEVAPAGDKRFAQAVKTGGYALREDRDALVAYHYEQAHTATAEYVFTAEFAGEFRLPPARAERMYRPVSGGHSAGFTLRVEPK